MKAARKNKAIAERIKTVLTEKGWTQVKLSEASGISRPRLSVILKGEENLTMETIATLETAMKAQIINVIEC